MKQIDKDFYGWSLLRVSEAEKELILKVLEYQIKAKSPQAKWIVSFLDDNQVPIAEEIVRKLR
jgi:ribonucleotide reductase beta subunit family protein with ferritin-like domain